jgi:hypothetical protein
MPKDIDGDSEGERDESVTDVFVVMLIVLSWWKEACRLLRDRVHDKVAFGVKDCVRKDDRT